MYITNTTVCHQPKSTKIVGPTFLNAFKFTFLLSSCLSKAHFCLHCSQLTGGPYLISEFVQRWHLFPIKAAIILQYSQAVGFPYDFTFCSHFLQIVLVLPLAVCWNSDRQYVHFTTGNAPRHSYVEEINFVFSYYHAITQ